MCIWGVGVLSSHTALTNAVQRDTNVSSAAGIQILYWNMPNKTKIRHQGLRSWIFVNEQQNERLQFLHVMIQPMQLNSETWSLCMKLALWPEWLFVTNGRDYGSIKVVSEVCRIFLFRYFNSFRLIGLSTKAFLCDKRCELAKSDSRFKPLKNYSYWQTSAKCSLLENYFCFSFVFFPLEILNA